MVQLMRGVLLVLTLAAACVGCHLAACDVNPEGHPTSLTISPMELRVGEEATASVSLVSLGRTPRTDTDELGAYFYVWPEGVVDVPYHVPFTAPGLAQTTVRAIAPGQAWVRASYRRAYSAPVGVRVLGQPSGGG